MDLEDRMVAAGKRYTKAMRITAAARAALEPLVVEAQAAGIPERRVAELLGVDRMTVRKWVGKR